MHFAPPPGNTAHHKVNSIFEYWMFGMQTAVNWEHFPLLTVPFLDTSTHLYKSLCLWEYPGP